MTWPGWLSDIGDGLDSPDHYPDPTVYVTDPDEPSATLLGPDGTPIAHVVPRRPIPIGFRSAHPPPLETPR